MMKGRIDIGTMNDCENLPESYGEICVKCNKCGRYDQEKQIEEMANVIDGLNNAYDTYWRSHCEQLAEELYNAGYRKQSEGEWLVDAWDNEREEWVTIPYCKHLHADAFCSLCKAHALLDGKEYGVASNYCPNCGARMKGITYEKP